MSKWRASAPDSLAARTMLRPAHREHVPIEVNNVLTGKTPSPAQSPHTICVRVTYGTDALETGASAVFI
jgi:hypothetical protein